MLTMDLKPDLRGIAARRRNLLHLALLLRAQAENYECPQGATAAEFEQWCLYARPRYDALKARANACWKQAAQLAVSGVQLSPRAHHGRRWRQQLDYTQTELSRLWRLPYWEQNRHARKIARLMHRQFLALWIRRHGYTRLLSAAGKELGHTELAMHSRMAGKVVAKAWRDPKGSYGYVLTRNSGWTHGVLYEHSMDVSVA